MGFYNLIGALFFYLNLLIMRSISFFIFSILCFGSNAQSFTASPISSSKCDTIAKVVVDQAAYRVFYDYKYAPDADLPNEKYSALTFLQIGKSHNRFMDYNAFRSDSINDINARNSAPMIEYFAALQNATKSIGYEKRFIIDRRKKQQIAQERVALQVYQYEEPVPAIGWNLISGDSIIAGYDCKKAACNLYGREYIAWYAPDVQLPYGPYQFNGLPGLIFKITDTENNFDFTISGLQQIDYYDPIYVREYRDIVKSSRKEVRKIEKNYCANPAKGLKNSGKTIIMSDEDWESIPPKPYNPIDRQ